MTLIHAILAFAVHWHAPARHYTLAVHPKVIWVTFQDHRAVVFNRRFHFFGTIGRQGHLHVLLRWHVGQGVGIAARIRALIP